MIIKEVFSKCYNKERYKYIYDLIQDFSFNYAVVKGDVLSMQAYNKCNQRYYTDVDILLSIDDLPKAQEALISHGYKCMCNNRSDRILMISSSHQSPSYTLDLPSPWQPLIVDINHDIFWGEYDGRRIDMRTFLEDTIDMIVQDVSIKVLSPIKAMIQLVLHHYKDMNSIYLLSKCNSINNQMFADLYNLLMNNLNIITLGNLYNISLKYNIVPYVYYMLFYTNLVYKSVVLDQYLDAFKTPEGESLIECYGLCVSERKKWRCDFLTRLNSNNIYELISNDLSAKDIEKIHINERMFRC